MNPLKIAASAALAPALTVGRDVVALDSTDFTDVAAVVVSVAEARSGILGLLRHTGFSFPVFLAVSQASEAESLPPVTGLLDGSAESLARLAQAAEEYEAGLLPPFFDTLTKYVAMNNSTFACPGHQGGAFFKKHPAGRQFWSFYGENLFRSDMCNADVRLGDLLIHEGSAKDAQKFAAKVFNADKTYFVLNGTSSANKVVTNALLTRGDL
ncbi:MAG: Orn/Lys/Arg decarboxylase N-terminal domain-containing protein, partial [Mixta calida]|nr:Orn/Lys/Arg decarboxylase N-terminal domain-containing protein [Mixta calida]